MAVGSDALGKKVMRQRAVYWAPLGLDPSGVMQYDEPIEVPCRWDQKAERYLSADGEEKTSSAVVIVDRVCKLGGVLWKGKIDDLTDEADPFLNPEAEAIKGTVETPNRKANKFFRSAIL